MKLRFHTEDEQVNYTTKIGADVVYKRRYRDRRYFFVWILSKHLDVVRFCVQDDFGNLVGVQQ